MTTKQKIVDTENADVRKDIKEKNKVAASQVISELENAFQKDRKGLCMKPLKFWSIKRDRSKDLHLQLRKTSNLSLK